IRLNSDRLRACGLDSRQGRLGIRSAGPAVVMNRHGLGTLLRQISRNQAAEVFSAAGDQYDFALNGMVCHGKSPVRMERSFSIGFGIVLINPSPLDRLSRKSAQLNTYWAMIAAHLSRHETFLCRQIRRAHH